MGRVVRHEACPACRKNGKDRRGDNLGVYSDGSTYCFSCGFKALIQPSRQAQSLGVGNLLPSIYKPRREAINASITLPEDINLNFPLSALEWVSQYELNRNDLNEHKVVWSDLYSRLIFPYYATTKSHLLGWQGRYFGEDCERPKWYSRGDLGSIYHILGDKSKNSTITLVEDIISAIKISKVGHKAMPLFGSHINSKRLHNLKLLCNQINIWLDPDKRIESVKFAEHSLIIGLPCEVIFSEKDPKEESFGRITEILK